MISLMIVDDEAVIRHGMRQAVDWSQYDISIAAEAKNGKIALEKALALRPDIIVSDIRMPDGDGLEFVKKLLEIYPHTKLIMLSGYSDMDYMMEAIKLGVRDYLLKPAGSAQILQSVLKLRDEIYLERETRRHNVQRENLLNENLGTLKSEFISDLLDGKIPEESLTEKSALLQLSFPGPLYMTFSVKAKKGCEWELIQLMLGLFEDYSPILDTPSKGRLVVAVLNVREPIPKAVLNEVALRIQPLTDSLLLPCATTVCAKLHELYKPHRDALNLMSRSIWFDEPFLQTDMLPPFPPAPNDAILICERDIVTNIRSGSLESARLALDALFQSLRESRPPIEDFRGVIMRIAHSMCLFGDDDAILTRLKKLFSGEYTTQQVENILMSATDNDYDQYGPQIKKVLTFLDQNYMHDITLTSVAAPLYISPSYLTRLLKSKTGMGFGGWLHTVRIEKAKKLLENPNLRHYEIAEMVGYKSYKIFSEYFNKIAGQSAGKFRESSLKGRKHKAAPAQHDDAPG